MKNFNRITYYFLFFTAILFTVSCSTPEDEDESIYGLEGDFQTAHKDASNAAKAKVYTADLSALNGSGVSGTAELVLEGNELTVTINATGLEPGMTHPQHIHGFEDTSKNSKCPPASADDDGDGLVELGEGLPFYGPVKQPLTPFPMAPDGTITFMQTYTVNTSINPLQNRVIVLHGMTVDGQYIATLPVACGEIQPAQGKNR